MPAAIPIVAAGVGAAGSIIGANKAANAQENAANQASATQLQMYNQTRADQTPWRTAGGQAVNALSQWYGLGGVDLQSSVPDQPNSTFPQNGIYAGDANGLLGHIISRIPNPKSGPITASGQSDNGPSQAPIDFNKVLSNLPGYQFQLDQGQQAVERNLAARGLLASGAAGKALTEYGQGVASNYAQQYVNGLQSLAGLGQTSAQATGAAGANAANQIGSNQIYAGNAAASGYANTSNAINSGLQGLAGAYGYTHPPSPQNVSSPYIPAYGQSPYSFLAGGYGEPSPGYTTGLT